MNIRPILLLMLFLPLFATAEVNYKSHVLKFAAQAGFSSGGDELAEAEVDGWGGDYTDSVDAGGGAFFSVGALFQLRNIPLDMQLGFGLHSDGIYGTDDNDEIDFTRGIFEGTAHYRKGNHRIGGGLTLHMDPEFEYDVDGVYLFANFDDAMGLIAEYRYMFDERFSLGFRYVSIDYELDGLAEDIDGDHVGFVFGIFL